MAINAKLRAVYTLVAEWCTARNIKYDIVCDEDNLQGILLFKKDRSHYQPLHNYINSIRGPYNVHCETVRTRAGAVILFSLGSLTEAERTRILRLLPEVSPTIPLTYRDRIVAIFDSTNQHYSNNNNNNNNTTTPDTSMRDRLLVSAKHLAEAQRKSPTAAHSRSGANAQFRSSITKGHSDGTKSTDDTAPAEPSGDTSGGTAQSTTVHGQSTNKATTKAAVGLTKAEEFTIALDTVLNELDSSPVAGAQVGGNSLGGMGADHQPNDLFERFAQALKVLGARMHLGKPVQDLLKDQGINWKKSEDGQALIFFVQNAATNAPQPIARVGYQTLAKPQEFQVQLAAMLDFAQGKAPGATQQEYEAAQEANKQLRDIATSLAPQDPQKQQVQAAAGVGGGMEPAAPTPAAPTGGVGGGDGLGRRDRGDPVLHRVLLDAAALLGAVAADEG